jgi:hypothetical protein
MSVDRDSLLSPGIGVKIMCVQSYVLLFRARVASEGEVLRPIASGTSYKPAGLLK